MISKRMIGGAIAGVAGVAGAAAGGAVALRHRRARPDPAREEDFGDLEGTTKRTIPTSDGGEVHVFERGTGRPFLLLHGVTMTTLSWHYQMIDLVDAGYRVVAADQRGHGQSTAGKDGYDLERMALDIYEILQVLDLRDCVAVGHSMGAMVLIEMLDSHPELVTEGVITALALISTSASPVLGNGLPAIAAEAVRILTPVAGRGHIRATAGRAGRSRPPGDLAALYCRIAFGSRPSPTHIELVRGMSSAVPAPIVTSLVRTLLALDVREALPDIAVPTVVIVGSRDLVTPVWHSRYTARNIPGAELHELAGCGHMVMFERRVEVARLLIDLARRTAPDARPVTAAAG